MEKLIFMVIVLTVFLKAFKLFIKKKQMIYWKFQLYIKQCHFSVWSVKKKIQKIKPEFFKDK